MKMIQKIDISEINFCSSAYYQSDKYKLNVSFFNAPIFQEARTFSKAEAWTELVLWATPKAYSLPINDYKVVIERGQILDPVKFLQKRWGWWRRKVMKFLKTLENLGYIKIESIHGVVLITIYNYDNCIVNSD